MLEKTLESPLDSKEIKPVNPKGNQQWSSNTLATWHEELTHWERPWWWERLKAGREGEDRGGDGWMATPNQWTWVWASSGRRWRTGRPGVLQSMGSQRVRHNLAIEQQQPFIYLLGYVGLGCRMRDLCCVMWDLWFWGVGSGVAMCRLSCCLMYVSPEFPGIKHTYPALQGGFSSTGPPPFQ